MRVSLVTRDLLLHVCGNDFDIPIYRCIITHMGGIFPAFMEYDPL